MGSSGASGSKPLSAGTEASLAHILALLVADAYWTLEARPWESAEPPNLEGDRLWATWSPSELSR